jgi:hypothetical protein
MLAFVAGAVVPDGNEVGAVAVGTLAAGVWVGLGAVGVWVGTSGSVGALTIETLLQPVSRATNTSHGKRILRIVLLLSQ